jgi:hypothetical protein
MTAKNIGGIRIKQVLFQLSEAGIGNLRVPMMQQVAVESGAPECGGEESVTK